MANANSVMQKFQESGNKALVFLFLSVILCNFVSALMINEIMYDLNGSDTKREWIEIYNNESNINLSGWKFYEAETNHGLTLINGSWIIENNSYAVIADNVDFFLIDNPEFNGTLFDSSFSLSNSGEILSLKNSSLVIVDSIFYNSSWGANGTGESLQFFNDNWCAEIPTPGAMNNCSQQDQIQENQTDQSSNQSTDQLDNSDDLSNNENEISSGSNENKMIYNINYPSIVYVEENFSVEVEAKNEQNHSQTIEAWSYVYDGSSCLSCSDNESRESNKQKIEIDSNDTETILLNNSVKKDIESGEYKLKIKILKEGLKTPKEFTFNISVINSNTTISSNKEESQTITSNAISNLQNITLANYESKSERNKQLALYLLIFFLLMIIIKKEGFLS